MSATDEFPYTPLYDQLLADTGFGFLNLGDLPGWGKAHETKPTGVGAPDAAGDRGAGSDVPPDPNLHRPGSGEHAAGPAPDDHRGNQEARSDSGGQR